MVDFLGSIKRDLIHAARSLSKDKVFSLVCVASLGIGMGALVALSLFGRFLNAPALGITTDGVAEVLVLPEGPLRTKAGVWALEQWSYPDYRALRDAETGMAVTGWVRESTELGTKVPGDKDVRRVVTLYVSANYFNTFGVTLAKGPGFDPAIDDAASAEPRVVLSDDFWRLQMSSDPDVVGKSVMLDGVLHTVVGVAPRDFRGHFHLVQAPGSMVFVPLERHARLRAAANVRNDRTMDWIHIHAKLNPGVDFQRANALVSPIVSGLAKQYPSTNEFKAAAVEPYSSMGAADIPQRRNVLRVMLGLAAAVLLVVCLNISGMMLVRGTAREKELSIRAALGAARQRLIQHLFFEALLLAVVAAAISAFVLFGIPAIAGWYLGAPVPKQFNLDVVNVLIASGLCLIVSVGFGLLPAIRFSRPSLITAMKDDAGGGGTNTIRVHRLAAMVQIGIAVPFLVISGVMLDRVRTADFGFPLDGLAGARVPANVLKDRDAGSLRAIRENLKQASGVQSVAIAEGMPIDFDYREYRVSTANGAASATAHVTHVGENFVETVGAKLLRGRTISADDGLMAAPVAVISTALAAQLYSGAEAIGEKVTFTLDDSREQEATIVGITNDFATSQLTTTRLQMLLPMQGTTAALNAQRAPSDEDAPLETTVQLIVRGAPGDEPRLRSALEIELRALGVEPLPGVAFPGIVSGQDMTEKSIGDLISESVAVGVVGGLVLVLAALGIIGVVGFMVATRTKEFAIRMALGSTRLAVFRMTLFGIVKLVVPGVLGGIALAAVLIRTMEDVLGTPLQLGPDPLGIMEPLIYAGASAIAVTAALLAGMPAARRATKVAPMVAIKAE